VIASDDFSEDKLSAKRRLSLEGLLVSSGDVLFSEDNLLFGDTSVSVGSLLSQGTLISGDIPAPVSASNSIFGNLASSQVFFFLLGSCIKILR